MDTVPLLRAASLDDVPHGFTTREGRAPGSAYEGLNLGRRPGEPEAALREAWARVARSLDPRLRADDVALVEQVHGAGVARVLRPGGLVPLGRADALVTRTPGV